MINIREERWVSWLFLIIFGIGALVIIWDYRRALADLVVLAVCIWMIWQAVKRLT
jgi:hypothetical protein